MTEHTTKTAMTTPTTAEHTEPAIKWAQSLLHHAEFPDPVSMYCAIPAHSVEAAARYLASVERENEDARATIARLEGEKNGAYRERNAVVAWAARVSLALGYHVAVTKTAIDGWDPSWHNCVYIDTPQGQASWHFHDTDAALFADLPRAEVAWDGHTTPEKYERLHSAQYTNQRADAAERRVDDMAPLARLGEWALERIRGVYAGDVDAFDVQDKATQFGVIAPQTAPKPCGDCCVCAEMDADVCYRDTDTTTRARAFLAAASGAADGAATREG